MSDDTRLEEVTDEDLVSSLANTFDRAAYEQGARALQYPADHFPSMARYRDYSTRAMLIKDSKLEELSEADLQRAKVLGHGELVAEIERRREEFEQGRDQRAVEAMERTAAQARVDQAYEAAAADQRETDRKKEENQREYQKALAARQAREDLQRAEELESQAQKLQGMAFDSNDAALLTKKAGALRAEAAALRGQR